MKSINPIIILLDGFFKKVNKQNTIIYFFKKKLPRQSVDPLSSGIKPSLQLHSGRIRFSPVHSEQLSGESEHNLH